MQKTLTDEAAVRFLAQSPSLKKHFVELPEGWEDEVKAFQVSQPKAPATEITEVNVTEKTAVVNEPATGQEVTTVTEEAPVQADQAPAPEAKPAQTNKNPFKKKR
jgi:hypothetical protein